ncbi:MAG: arsenate reductase ArsC [Ketobacteraceae bacterium]|nr:arsenate reductase ArsC [Ketobacteraceae bacterium]
MEVSRNDKPNVLFLCTGNSCRSQMAEGWAKRLKPGAANFYSAGIETHGLNPNAVQVMAEAGVDISSHRSQSVAELADVRFDWVFSVCDHARKTCPELPGSGHHVAALFDDPPALASSLDSEADRLAVYRRVRDEIRAFVEALDLSGGSQ